ncbi:MAG: radical SAM protein [Desulforhabdus sp.]|jgi:putative pyruvate formate lyase activating enzyme|nr:radical SAM protein [Desulforhabdus sp.]
MKTTAPLDLHHYRKCRLCPWNCDVDRWGGDLGRCAASARLKVDDYMLHFGEEACLVGEGGSGAVFFSFCTLRCRFCQTHEISWRGTGSHIEVERLAEIFLWLQEEGAENLNLITPGHFLPHIIAAIHEAQSRGMHLPIVYNTSSFESVEVLRTLDGIIDIYLPDFKFWRPETARRLCGAELYPDVAREAVKEMHRQVGDLVLDAQGRALRGVLLRHLVLPGHLDESRHILYWLAKELSVHTYVNVMGSYRPCHQAKKYPPIDRALSREEFEAVEKCVKESGLYRLDKTHRLLNYLIWSKR